MSPRGESVTKRQAARAPSAGSADRSARKSGTAASHKSSLKQLPPPLDESLLRDGWIRLFDGSTLFGWESIGSATWRVQEGSIEGEGSAPGFLRTTTPFADYVLHVEYRCPSSTNSGVFVRTTRQPESPETDAYEINIAPPPHPFATGSVVTHAKADAAAVAKVLQDKGPEVWHTMEITLDRSQLQVDLDGATVLTWGAATPRRFGWIALQQNQGPIAFRNIRLKPLHREPLFDGKTLGGWRTHPKLEGTFTVTGDGALRVQGGRGQLETEGTYGDFLLSLECKTQKTGLNSGVFFRCIPGDVMMGYESQIHNGYRDGDRTKPVDCGTGGIFRRRDARIVAADDLTWFHQTIVATGPHIAVWVNGLQVTDWTDDRKPDPNPRRGLRRAPGSIMLQAHDPTTDVLFRNLRIVKLDGITGAGDSPSDSGSPSSGDRAAP